MKKEYLNFKNPASPNAGVGFLKPFRTGKNADTGILPDWHLLTISAILFL